MSKRITYPNIDLQQTGHKMKRLCLVNYWGSYGRFPGKEGYSTGNLRHRAILFSNYAETNY